MPESTNTTPAAAAEATAKAVQSTSDAARANAEAARVAANAAVDEALRITAETSRRTTDTARLAVDAARGYLDQAAPLNRQVLALGLASTRASLQAAFDLQNAAFATGLQMLDTTAKIQAETIKRYADIARQAQQSTLDGYQASASLLESLTK